MQLAHAIHLALGFPEVTESPHFEAHSFRVGKRIFATLPPADDHMHVFVDEVEVHTALASGAAGLSALHWGSKLAGLRVELRHVAPEVLRSLLESAWRRRAPKRAIAAFDKGSKTE